VFDCIRGKVLRRLCGSAARLLALVHVGCLVPTGRRPIPYVPPATLSPPPAEGTVLPNHPELRVLLRAPSRAPYVPRALGPSGQTIELRVVNTGAKAFALHEPLVTFVATLGDVSFPCAKAIGRSPGTHEPSVLGTGEVFAFERDLRCTMPLPGRYEVSVYADFGTEGRSEFVGAFGLTIEANGGAPKPYPSRPGLYVAMTAEQATRPMPADAWARGDYHVIIAAVNGGARAMAVGAAHISFLTYRRGSAIPCSGRSESATFADELAPGAMDVTRVPITCAPAEEGDYRIVGFLSFEGAAEIEIGSFALTVTRAPLLYTPDPWPPAADTPVPAE